MRLVLVTFVVALLTLALSCNGQSSTSMPIADDAHVPSMMRYYPPTTTTIPSIRSWYNITSPPTLTPNYAWFVSDSHYVYSLRISANDTSTVSNSIQVSTVPLPTPSGRYYACSQPVISPTQISNSTYTMYVVCQPNLIYTFTATDWDGEMLGLNYNTPIKVNFTTPNSGTLMLTTDLAVEQQNGGTTPDFLIVSGNGAIFTIDSSTGLHARQQWGPANTGIIPMSTSSKIQFIMTLTWNSAVGAPLSQLYCATNVSSNFYAFVLTYQQLTPYQQQHQQPGNITTPIWHLVTTIPFFSSGSSSYVWTRVQLFSTPNSIYYYLSGQKYWTDESVYRMQKEAPYVLRGISRLFPFDALAGFYDSPSDPDLTLALDGGFNPETYRIFFSNQSVESLYFGDVPSYGTPVVDAVNDKLWYVGWTGIVVVKLSSLLTYKRYDTVWYYQRVQDLTQNTKALNNQTLMKYTSWYLSSSSVRWIVPGVGESSNSLVVFVPESVFPSMSVIVLSSLIAPSCHDLPPPPVYNSSNSNSLTPACYCSLLTGTARECSLSATTQKCENSLQDSYEYSCYPSSGGINTPYSSERVDGTIIIVAVLCSVFGCFCCTICCFVGGGMLVAASNRNSSPPAAVQRPAGEAAVPITTIQVGISSTPSAATPTVAAPPAAQQPVVRAQQHQPVAYGGSSPSPIEMVPLSSPSAPISPSAPGGYQPQPYAQPQPYQQSPQSQQIYQPHPYQQQQSPQQQQQQQQQPYQPVSYQPVPYQPVGYQPVPYQPQPQLYQPYQPIHQQQQVYMHPAVVPAAPPAYESASAPDRKPTEPPQYQQHQQYAQTQEGVPHSSEGDSTQQESAHL